MNKTAYYIFIAFLIWTFFIGGYIYTNNIDVKSILFKMGHKESMQMAIMVENMTPSMSSPTAAPDGTCNAADPWCECDPDDETCGYTYCDPAKLPTCGANGTRNVSGNGPIMPATLTPGSRAQLNGGGGYSGEDSRGTSGAPGTGSSGTTADGKSGQGTTAAAGGGTSGATGVSGSGTGAGAGAGAGAGTGAGAGSGSKSGDGDSESNKNKKKKKGKNGEGSSDETGDDASMYNPDAVNSAFGTTDGAAGANAYNPSDVSVIGDVSGSAGEIAADGSAIGGEGGMYPGAQGDSNLSGSDVVGQYGKSCPDALVFKGGQYYLYNNKLPKEEGRNPIVFNTMDEYKEFYDAQKQIGNDCPVLYVQQEFDAQGNEVMRIRPTPGTANGRTQYIDADREHPPYNKGNYYGFDPTNMYNGIYTEVDDIHNITAKQKVSDNPMDHNWGGVEYTQRMIDAGKYKDNVVTRPNYSTPKNTQIIPILNSGQPLPK